MAWKAVDRITPVIDPDGAPLLSEATRDKIRSFFPRYETKQAVLLPALHIAQVAIGYVSLRAMRDIAELLEIAPAKVLDVVTFYTHFWTQPKGRKVILVCRSISCELCGGRELLDALKEKLGIEERGTTADGRYSLMTEECLACCDHAPCLLIGEKLHKWVKAEDVAGLLADEGNDRIDMARSDLFDPPEGAAIGEATPRATAGDDR